MGYAIYGLVLFALTLQIIGSAILGAFSFSGLQIVQNPTGSGNVVVN